MKNTLHAMRYTWPIIIIVPLLNAAVSPLWGYAFFQLYVLTVLIVWLKRGIVERWVGMNAKEGQTSQQ